MCQYPCTHQRANWNFLVLLFLAPVCWVWPFSPVSRVHKQKFKCASVHLKFCVRFICVDSCWHIVVLLLSWKCLFGLTYISVSFIIRLFLLLVHILTINWNYNIKTLVSRPFTQHLWWPRSFFKCALSWKYDLECALAQLCKLAQRQ